MGWDGGPSALLHTELGTPPMCLSTVTRPDPPQML